MVTTTFGQIVRERRNVLGLTQAELARRAGCATITVRKIEADDIRPSVQIAQQLAKALGVPDSEQRAFNRLARMDRPVTPIPAPLPDLSEIGAEDLSGRAIRGYELGERIGKGGFGVVYRAQQTSMQRDVAVKIILPRFANHPEFIRRFEAEARLVASLEHPHIVPLYDYWREPNIASLIMRYLKGGSLEHRLADQGPLGVEEVGIVLEQVGAALHNAHLSGIVHRDVKPANILLDDGRNAYLGDFGIAKNTIIPAGETQESALIGSPLYASPEQILSDPIGPQSDIYSLGLVLYELLTGEKPFKGPQIAHYIQQQLYQELPPLGNARNGFPPALDAVLKRATAKEPAGRFPDVPSLVAAYQQALAPISVRRPRVPLVEPVENPFKGLRPFNEADAADFYGRSTLVQELLTQLGEENDLARFLALVGASGSGKSSVVRAGLLPALRRGGLPGSENWFITDMLPGRDPFRELERALLRVATYVPVELLNRLSRDRQGLHHITTALLLEDREVELLLVIDQFEELFTLVEDESTRALFLESLVTAVLAPESRLRLVITLRADFTDRPLQYVDFGELVRQRNVFVLPLTPDELEEAITRPVLPLGLGVQPELTTTIIHDVGNQPGALPLLQYALTELFERRQEGVLTLQAYRESGGVSGALARRADEIYMGLDPAGQEAARQLYLRLVTLGEGVEDTRRRVARRDLRAMQLSSEHDIAAMMDRIIDLFGRHRLLTFDHDPATREPTVEVAHEALLREWGRLRRWLDESREQVRLQQNLASATAEWLRAGRDESYLLRGARLARYDDWNRPGGLALTPDEAAYLTTGRAARDRRAEEAAARLARELAAARQLAEEQQKRAEEQANAAQSLRRRAVILAGLLVVAAMLAVAAVAAGRQALANTDQAQANANLAATSALEAQTNAAIAATNAAESAANAALAQTRQAEEELQRKAAQNAQATAESAEEIAEQEREISEEQARLAISRELSLAAINNLDADPELSILLALQALETAYTKQAEEALHHGIQTSRVELAWKGHADTIQEFTYSPGGTSLASMGGDGVVRVWDTQNGDMITEFMTLKDATAAGGTLQYDETGRRLTALTRNLDWNQINLTGWDISSGEVVLSHMLPIITDQWSYFVINSEGTLLAVGYENGTSSLWNVQTKQKLLDFPPLTGRAWEISFSPDGSLLAVSSDEGDVSIWVVADLLEARLDNPIAFFNTNATEIGGDLVESAFAPDGTYLALSYQGGRAEIWDLSILDAPIHMLAGPTNSILGLIFSPDQTMMAAASLDGFTYVWSLETGMLLYKLGGHDAGVIRVNFSPDNEQITTGDNDGNIRIWDARPVANGEILTFISGPDNFNVDLSPDDKKVAVGYAVGPASVWDAHTAELLFTLTGKEDTGLYRAVFHPDGMQIVTVGEDNVIRIWDAESGELLHGWTGHEEGNSGGFFVGTIDVVYSPDGSRLATAGTDGIAKVWDSDTYDELLVLEGHTTGLHAIAYSPNGQYIATSSDAGDSSVKVWDAQTGQEIYSLAAQPIRAWGLAFSPDSSLLATSGSGGIVNVWDLATGKEIYSLPSQVGTVGSIMFTPDGEKLITSGGDALRVWDVDTGTELVTLASGEWGLALTQDGRYLYASNIGQIRVYILRLEDAIELAEERVTRSLTEEECQVYLHGPCPKQ